MKIVIRKWAHNDGFDWDWYVLAGNGVVVCVAPEEFSRKADAIRSAERMIGAVRDTVEFFEAVEDLSSSVCRLSKTPFKTL